MASDSSERLVLLDRLADEFAERCRRGERPTVQEYVDHHPELADQIRESFPSLAVIQPVKDDRGGVTEPSTTGPSPLPVSRRRTIAALGGTLAAVLFLTTIFSLIIAVQSMRQSRREARAAEEERIARIEADRAKEQEVRRREQAEAAVKAASAARKNTEPAMKAAEAATKAAEAGRTRAVAALRNAEENFARAREVVKDNLAAISGDARLKAPALSPLRDRLLRSALGFYQQFLWERGFDSSLRRELAAIYENVGTIYRDLGQQQPADRSYAESLRLYEALAAAAPADREIQDSLARALHRQGQNERAIAIWEKLVRPDDPRYQADLGNAYNDAAFQVKDDRAKALEFDRKALMIRERLVRLRPYDPAAKLALTASLNRIAHQLKGDRNQEALVLFKKALEQGEAAYRLHPSDGLISRFLITQLDHVATRAERAGETEEKLAAHRRRIEVLDRRARDNPVVSGFDAELVHGYAEFLDALSEAGRWDEATKVADRARERIAKTTEQTKAFFEGVLDFELAVYSIAFARSKAAPAGAVKTEPEAVAVLDALRQQVIAGWRSSNSMRTDPRTEPLRHRPDFNALLTRVNELGSADAAAWNEAATLEEKVGARRIILTALEAVARPLPPIRFNRRSLARARQDLARALLDVGRVEEARGPFDEALAERQRLMEEGPNDEGLRTELLQSQVSSGDRLAAAGRLEEAGAAWEEGLALLEADFLANPDRFPLRVALSDGLRQVGDQYGKLGRFADALRYYRRAFEVEAPATFTPWHQYALLMADAGDTEGFKALARRVANAKELTEAPRDSGSIEWQQWVPAVARVRLGQGNEGQARPAEPDERILNGIGVALAEHRLGHLDAARAELQQADREADRMARNAAVDPAMRLVKPDWPDWVYFRLLRREAHQTIEGKPMPDSPYDRLFRGRVLYAFGQVEKAEAEFAAAVALRRTTSNCGSPGRGSSPGSAGRTGWPPTWPGPSGSNPVDRGLGSRPAGSSPSRESTRKPTRPSRGPPPSARANSSSSSKPAGGWPGLIRSRSIVSAHRRSILTPRVRRPRSSRDVPRRGRPSRPRPTRGGSRWGRSPPGTRTARSTRWPTSTPIAIGPPRCCCARDRTPASG